MLENFQGDSWGSIPPLCMPNLLPQDLCQGQTTWPASWKTCMQVKKQELELDTEQQTGSKEEKEYVKAVYCHPAYLT